MKKYCRLILAAFLVWVPLTGTVGAASLSLTETPVRSVRVLDFIGSIGVNTKTDAASVYGPMFTYMGINKNRCGNTTTCINLYSGYGVLSEFVCADVTTCESTAGTLGAALLFIEGPNEPQNFNFTWLGNTCGGATWGPCAQMMSALYTSWKASAYSAIPIYGISQTGSASTNMGLSCTTAASYCSDPGQLALWSVPVGAAYSDGLTEHNYVGYFIPNAAWLSSQKAAAYAGNEGFYIDHVVTWAQGFQGYNTVAAALVPPTVTTETGFPMSGESYFTLSSLSWSGGMVTATASASTGYTSGQQFPATITGASPAGYNGTFFATATGSATFTYALASNPGGTSSTGSWNLASPVTQWMQGVTDLNMLFDQYLNGYLYSLIFEMVDGEGGCCDGYGLYQNTFAPKLAATFIHNLTTILADSSDTFSAGSLSYSLLGTVPSTMHSLLMEKSSGAYELAVWNEQDYGGQTITWAGGTATVTYGNALPFSGSATVIIPDALPSVYNGTFTATQTGTFTFTYPLASNPGGSNVSYGMFTIPSTITVSLGKTCSTLNVYDPTVGTTVQSTFSTASSVSLTLSDHPNIVECLP
jgi:hypothetical protein